MFGGHSGTLISFVRVTHQVPCFPIFLLLHSLHTNTECISVMVVLVQLCRLDNETFNKTLMLRAPRYNTVRRSSPFSVHTHQQQHRRELVTPPQIGA